MNLARKAIDAPLLTWLLILGCLLGGLWGYATVGRLEDTSFTIKQAVVITSYPGASAEQVAREVSEFLVSAFNAANPSKGELRGSSEVSARDVLEASQKRIDIQHWTSPLVKARLQSVLAQAYQNIGRSTSTPR